MRVVVADDSVLPREGLVRILAEGGSEGGSEGGTAGELLLQVRSCLPDIAITDIRMPPGHSDEGIRAARQIRARYPQVAVLVLSRYVELRYALDLLSDGAERLGCLLKDRVSDVGEFRAAVRRAAAGGSAVDPAVIAQLAGRRRDHGPLAGLTPREREVLALIAEGRSNHGIAARLVITEHAVESTSATSSASCTPTAARRPPPRARGPDLPALTGRRIAPASGRGTADGQGERTARFRS